MKRKEKIFFSNSWKNSYSKKYYKRSSIKYKKIYYYPDCDEVDLENVITSAKNGLLLSNNLSSKKKSKLLYNVYKQIIKNQKILAKLESSETGKKINEAENEIKHSARIWLYASKITKKMNHKVQLDKLHVGTIRYEPVGIVSLIVPWNYPFIVTSERLPFIISAGNSVIIKPSEFAAQSILYLMKIIKKAEFPNGLVNLITGTGEKIGKKITTHKDINMISFTGSTVVGKKIMSTSSRSIKRLSLELGGKNSLIVLKDADLKKTIKIIIKSFTTNAGQCCVSTSRVLVHQSIKEKLVNMLIKKLKKIKNYKKIYGPISTEKQIKSIKSILNRNKKYNKKIIFGDTKFKKNFINPIVFKDLPLNNTLNKKEIFGPLLTINDFKENNDAVQIANSTNYGLSSVICGKNKKNILNVAHQIKSGRVWVNQSVEKNYPNIPIGGFKESGLNRECGEEGIKTYSEIKSIIIKK